MGIAVKLGCDRYHVDGLGFRHRMVGANRQLSSVVARDGSANKTVETSGKFGRPK
jgi:hypothetical protein